jgi:superfamily II DNA or RNA helicase
LIEIEKSPNTFLTPAIMQGGDWRALELVVFRLLQHAGWKDIQYIGETGDKGADILAVKENSSFLFQVKSTNAASYVGTAAIEQAIQGQAVYRTKIVIVVTNGDFTASAHKRKDQLRKDGYDVRLWNGAFLLALVNKAPEYSLSSKGQREYQSRIIKSVIDRYNAGQRKALFIVATGLGKTVIASTIADKLFKQGLKKILVLCHATDLAYQLQTSFWPQISKEIPTRLFMAGEPPVPIDGINFGLYQTLFSYLPGLETNAFDLIIVDEAHHALANAFASCIEHLEPKLLIGMTATPWRGDGLSISSIFGEPIDKVSLVDGMKLGYLAKVDYRLMCDNIQWDELPKIAKKPISVRDLNKRLFLPQRDDAVIAEILKISKSRANTKIAIFSPSIAHAEEFTKRLISNGIKAANLSINDKYERRKILLDFSTGKINALTAVDVLNEGIDVPDVNLLVFLRATHSRRIFIQQLGRGLRIAPHKENVIVLDFVTDIRRIAAVIEIDNEAKSSKKQLIESVILKDGVVAFSDQRAQSFVDAWLHDVANLQDKDDEEKLTFPDIPAHE